MTDVAIVPYEKHYREVVRRCVFETGYGGANVAPFFTDRELFADLLTLYYTDYEPGHALIGVVDGEPAGYLLGCADTERYNAVMKKNVYPLIVRRLLRGEYQIDGLTLQYLVRGIRLLLHGAEVTPPAGQYPAHLHIDLFEPYRRFGLGTRLMRVWMDALRAMGSPGLHLGTSSVHTQSQPFYEKLGFRRYAVRRYPVSFFWERDQRDFYGIWYVMDLRPGP